MADGSEAKVTSVPQGQYTRQQPSHKPAVIYVTHTHIQPVTTQHYFTSLNKQKQENKLIK